MFNRYRSRRLRVSGADRAHRKLPLMIDGSALAREYVDAVQAAAVAGVNAEPEAQLTTPIKNLFEQVAPGTPSRLTLIREARLDGVRPDFAALWDGSPCGWMELKAPGRAIDGSKWRGREARQWELLAQLDSLIVSNGEEVVLYLAGEAVTKPVDLPVAADAQWDSGPLQELLILFGHSRPKTVYSVADLSMRLAPLARLLKNKIADLLG